jgi:hypothetical protein
MLFNYCLALEAIWNATSAENILCFLRTCDESVIQWTRFTKSTVRVSYHHASSCSFFLAHGPTSPLPHTHTTPALNACTTQTYQPLVEKTKKLRNAASLGLLLPQPSAFHHPHLTTCPSPFLQLYSLHSFLSFLKFYFPFGASYTLFPSKGGRFWSGSY